MLTVPLHHASRREIVAEIADVRLQRQVLAARLAGATTEPDRLDFAQSLDSLARWLTVLKERLDATPLETR